MRVPKNVSKQKPDLSNSDDFFESAPISEQIPESMEKPDLTNMPNPNKAKEIIGLLTAKLLFLISKIKPILSSFYNLIKRNQKINSILSRLKNLSKKNKIITSGVFLVVLIGLGFLFFLFPKEEKPLKNSPEGKKIEMFSMIKKAELVGKFSVNDKAHIGETEISIYNTKEGSFNSFDRDANDERIVKKYYAVGVKVFNASEVVNDIFAIGLEDDKGNQYAMDHSIAFYLGDMRDFGPDENIYHRTIREGYLIFPAPDDAAKKLKLIFLSKVSQEKVIFEIER